jgi:uncharacterized RmlC-like cupin family protein
MAKANLTISVDDEILKRARIRALEENMTKQDAGLKSVRPSAEVMTRQRLPYFIGISGNTVGSTGLSMHIVVIPPGAKAEPHVHLGYETGIYVPEGRVLTRWGVRLERELVSEAGDFLFVPPGVPHEAANLSAAQAARAVVARNDSAEQDKVAGHVPPSAEASDV